MKPVLTIFLAAVASLLAVYAFGPTGGAGAAAVHESAYERVMRTGTLRCGYAYWTPGVYKDDDTGNLKGFIVDIVEKIGTVGEVKIEWVAPIDWGSVAQELASGKIDAMCAGMWQSGLKSKVMLFTEPMSYEGIVAYVRKDSRLQKLDQLNDPAVTIAAIDNDNGAYIANENFPKAKRMSMPLGATDGDLLMNVVTGKADVIFTSPGQARVFEKLNPGAVRGLENEKPLRIFGNTLVVNAHEYQLLHFLNTTLAEIENSGFINNRIDAYSAEYPFLRKASGVAQ